jgi:PTH1 family peptidyl-tRNA hydrolase
MRTDPSPTGEATLRPGQTAAQPDKQAAAQPEGQAAAQPDKPIVDVDLPAIIVGLGNPGNEYENHRHNIGFRVVEALARAHDLRFVRHKGSKAHVAEGRIGKRSVRLAKPQTFMNLSGQAVGRLSRAYEIEPAQILVVYDDLDLPLGRLRLRPEGGSGGHKGIRSIVDTMGTQAFPRLRVGIDRPPGRQDPADYVLQPFSKADEELVGETIERAVCAIECWLAEGIVSAMDQYNQAPPHQDGSHQEDGR